jgi:drug/metabolite transporter (DMT)-like permease
VVVAPFGRLIECCTYGVNLSYFKFKENSMINKESSSYGTLEMITAMILMGTVGYFVVEADQDAHNIVFFRCLFGGVFLALYGIVIGIFKNTELTTKKVFLIVLSGIFLILNWIMLFESFKSASISTSTVVYHTQPFFFVLIGTFILRETISLDKVLWMVLAFIGVFLVANISIKDASLTSIYVVGLLLAILAAIFWAISAMIVKQIKGVKPHLIILIQLIIGALILFPFINTEDISSVTNVQWSYLAILGGVHTCLVYVLMYSSYSKLSTPVIAVLTFIYPTIAILVDFVFYNMYFSILQFVGVFLIMFSSYAVNQNIKFMFTKSYMKEST